ncbi:MAG TPA: glucoamylase family protein [Verrucomicrobiae bacterium]
MKPSLYFQVVLLAASSPMLLAINAPTGLVSRTGDQSIVLHWDANSEPDLAGYRVYRSTNSVGPFALQTPVLLTSQGFCDLPNNSNGRLYYYQVTAVTTASQESPASATLTATPHPFASDDEFLDYVQQTSFDYFWYTANPVNGLVPDRTPTGSACSIAAVGFGLTAIGIGIDHGWISRTQGVARVLTTLNTFLQGPQGPGASGTIGYNGWFYHFLDMKTAVRSGAELSSIDTTLLLAGMLYAKQYFDGTNANEGSIRTMVDTILNRVDWNWMARGTDAVSMGWIPGSGFISANWIGYNEAMILCCLGLGAAANPLPASAWNRWTSGYTWGTNYGQSYIQFGPLFGHQYSHCWIDFRHIGDAYVNSRQTTYFENSRRASLAQVAYCSTAPHAGYSSNVWGLTASDGPDGYAVHGLPPTAPDDGTITPTAAGGSIAFAPEYCLPALRAFYTRFRPRIWTAYGFRDAFNIERQWYASDELGIDQGPIVIMIENYRTQRVWRLFMQNPEVQRGLQRAGFIPLAFVDPSLQALPDGAFNLAWMASAGRSYQVEYSPELITWTASSLGFAQASASGLFNWVDDGPPATVSAPSTAPQRFYRVFQVGQP